MMSKAEQSLLGKQTVYCSQYDKSLLFPIPRQDKRDELAIKPDTLPFAGIDVWTAFEVSWLNSNGLPQVRVAQFEFAASSPFLVESKSFKLYLNSFNGTVFESEAKVVETLEVDLTEASGADAKVTLLELTDQVLLGQPDGICLDQQDITIDNYELQSAFLKQGEQVVEEQVYSHLLKSNCLVTGQPDWGTIVIRYAGKQIDHQGLLKYIVSYRNHMEFHEQCVERVFCDIMRVCQPEKLLVYARYLRRGGLDINPYRANYEVEFDLRRLVRQ